MICLHFSHYSYDNIRRWMCLIIMKILAQWGKKIIMILNIGLIFTTIFFFWSGMRFKTHAAENTFLNVFA